MDNLGFAGICFLVSAFCLVYFFMKGLMEEGWSRFAFAWGVLLAYGGVLLIFPPFGVILTTYWLCGIIFVGVIIDYSMILREGQRGLIIIPLIGLCVGVTFYPLIYMLL